MRKIVLLILTALPLFAGFFPETVQTSISDVKKKSIILSSPFPVNGMSGVVIHKYSKDLDETLLTKFLQTQNGYFTRPLNAGDRYISYKIISKEGTVFMAYEQAKGAVLARWRQKQQSHALKDYFEKLRSNADIEILR